MKPSDQTKENPWPENHVPLTEPSVQLVDEFIQVLNDARDERPLQSVLAANPVLLRALLPPASRFWFFDRPRFGSQFIPDFLICNQDSTGFNWKLVEIESPTKSALNSRGRMSSGLTEAIGQIHDWRIWLRKNISYAHAELGFTDINAECHCIIIIGRRAQVNPKQISQYREISNGKLTVMTYDRMVDSVRSITK